MSNSLAAQIESTPTAPGLYFLWSSDMDCLYIGKAENLHDRLTHHLQEYNRCQRMREMDGFNYEDPEMAQFAIEQFADQTIDAHLDQVRYITVKRHSSEPPLTTLEKHYIQAFQPEYNVHHNHDPVTQLEKELFCPECGNKLQYRKTAGTAGGYVCKNSRCSHYWKMGDGDVVEVATVTRNPSR